MSVALGIDVGYSKSKKTCGLAVAAGAGVSIQGWPGGGGYWTTRNGGTVLSTTMSIDALVASLPHLVRANPGAMTVVIDGPLAPDAPPTNQRHVDRECQRGAFQRRAVPASVNGGGRKLVEATCRITDSLVGTRSGPHFCFSAKRTPNGPPLQIFETMPTIGLAVLLKMIPEEELAEIPSRSKPIGGVRQKSDFYWEKGGGFRIAEILGCPDVANEGNHDRRAALYCVAVATQIADSSSGSAICIGNPATGVFVFAGPEDLTWMEELNRVGRV